MSAHMEVLVPVSVPWAISPSVPYLRLNSTAEGRPFAATFIGFFKCEPSLRHEGRVVISDPGPFVQAETAKGSSHRLVQVVFNDGLQSRRRPAFSEHEILAEALYDWSLIPSGIRDEETAEESVARVSGMWLSTGICPDPSMYEVRGSKWLAELQLAEGEWRHYILLGHDDYVEVVARDWRWIPGQAVA